MTRLSASIAITLLLSLQAANAEDAHLRRGKSRNLRFDFSEYELPNQFCWVPFASCEADNCEPVTPLGANEFNVTRYIEKSWFIQKQQVNPYQSEDQLYCVVATYNQRDDGFIQVQNTAMTGGVNGVPQNSDNDSWFSDLCAKQIEGGSLQVAPCIFRLAFGAVAGPYWVLALDEEKYSWAIVSGGQPNEVRETVNGRTFCTTKEGSSFLDTNGSGLWLFTRSQVATQAQIDIMENKLTEMGIYTGDLKNVTQEGCTYPDTTKF